MNHFSQTVPFLYLVALVECISLETVFKVKLILLKRERINVYGTEPILNQFRIGRKGCIMEVKISDLLLFKNMLKKMT